MTKSTNKASEDLLGEIHGLMAKNFLRKLQEHPDDITPSELNTMRQFLKDNGISCDPAANEDLSGILKLLPSFDKQEAVESV